MKNKIEVGDYIRTNNGIIGKIKRIELEPYDSLKWYVFEGKRFGLNIIDDISINKPYIVNYSKNIIDLVQVGDVVEFKEKRTILSNVFGTKFLENFIMDIHDEEELEIFKEEVNNKKAELISILSRKQYEKNCYRVGE